MTRADEHEPFILPFAGVAPIFGGPPAFAGPRCAVIGRATIGPGAWLGEDCVVRADGQVVRLGANIHLGHRATVHIVHDTTPCLVGDNVTVGSNTIVHACRVGDNCVFEDDVTILDDAVVGANVVVEAGSTVFPRKRLDAGWVYRGSPAKPVREVWAGELARRAASVRARHGSARALSPNTQDFGGDVFIAHTAQRAGRLMCAPGSSLFFSCLADAGTGAIYIGENTNVQDNSILRADLGEIVIGRDTTIGHNVAMGPARVGDNTLVGISAVLAADTWVQDDVLLAGAAHTEPGQVLESGWMWGGRPAKALSRLDEARRTMMRSNVRHYLDYARAFRLIQAEHLAAPG